MKPRNKIKNKKFVAKHRIKMLHKKYGISSEQYQVLVTNKRLKWITVE